MVFGEGAPGGYGVRRISNAAAEPYESVRHAYDTVAEDYATMIPDTRAEAALDLAMVDAFAAGVGKGARVLDAGCGAGRMSRYLAGRGLAVQGIDLSPGMVAMARRDHPASPSPSARSPISPTGPGPSTA